MKAYNKSTEKQMKCKYEDVYYIYKHSDDMCQLMINADMLNVDITNPYVLMALVDLTTYHASFWPHTANRFEAFKDMLKNDINVQEAIKNNKFKDMLECYYENWIADFEATSDWNSPGKDEEKKNIEEVIAIVNSICK